MPTRQTKASIDIIVAVRAGATLLEASATAAFVMEWIQSGANTWMTIHHLHHRRISVGLIGARKIDSRLIARRSKRKTFISITLSRTLHLGVRQGGQVFNLRERIGLFLVPCSTEDVRDILDIAV